MRERDGHYGMVRNHAQGILLRPDDRPMPGRAGSFDFEQYPGSRSMKLFN